MEQSADRGGQLPLVQSGSLARMLMLPARPIAGSNDSCDRKAGSLNAGDPDWRVSPGLCETLIGVASCCYSRPNWAACLPAQSDAYSCVSKSAYIFSASGVTNGRNCA